SRNDAGHLPLSAAAPGTARRAPGWLGTRWERLQPQTGYARSLRAAHLPVPTRSRVGERSADRSLTKAPPGPTATLTWDFTQWQVLGSNQRRLSRRFYRALPASS